MMDAVTKKVKEIADVVTNASKKVLEIHSPSRKTEELGAFPVGPPTDETKAISEKILAYMSMSFMKEWKAI